MIIHRQRRPLLCAAGFVHYRPDNNHEKNEFQCLIFPPFPSPNAGPRSIPTGCSSIRSTPNGVKVSIMLEEIGLPYEPHLVDFGKDDQKTPEFLSLNPNGKIPAIIDPDGPGGKPLGLFESGAILQYLAEKTGKLLRPIRRGAGRPSSGCISRWAGSGRCSARSASSTNSPARSSRTSVRCDRYVKETKRLLGVIDTRLDGRHWIMDENTPSPTSRCSAGCAT